MPLTARELVLLAWSLPRHVAKVDALMDRFTRRTGKKLSVVPKTGGARSQALQATIHADSLAAARKGQGYRAAPADRSKHTRGAGTDLHVVGETSGDAARDAKNPYYVILAEEARAVGLKPGLDFKGGDPDPYHVEEPETLEQLDREYSAFLRGRLWRALAAALGIGLVAYWFFFLRKRS